MKEKMENVKQEKEDEIKNLNKQARKNIPNS